MRRSSALLGILIALGSALPVAASPARAFLPYFSHVTMMGASSGWGLAGCHILRTTSGWATWQDLTPSALPCTSHVATEGIGFAALDMSTAVAAMVIPSGPHPNRSVAVVRTTNGGRSWTRTTVRIGEPVEYVTQLLFVTRSVGWMNVLRGVGAGQAYYAIYRTADSGARWVLVTRAGGVNATTRVLPSCDCGNQISFRTPNIGWATGELAFQNPGLIYLFRTPDGGRTWSPQPFPLPYAWRHSLIATYSPLFFGGKGVMPVTFSFPGTNRQGLDVYHSSDGGATWHSSRIALLSTNGPGPQVLSSSLVFLPSNGRIARTEDGGYHWVRFVPQGLPTSLQQLDMLNNRLGFAVGEPSNGNVGPLFKTTDGGRIWTRVS